jgi:hypothetical protein
MLVFRRYGYCTSDGWGDENEKVSRPDGPTGILAETINSPTTTKLAAASGCEDALKARKEQLFPVGVPFFHTRSTAYVVIFCVTRFLVCDDLCFLSSTSRYVFGVSAPLASPTGKERADCGQDLSRERKNNSTTGFAKSVRRHAKHNIMVLVLKHYSSIINVRLKELPT